MNSSSSLLGPADASRISAWIPANFPGRQTTVNAVQTEEAAKVFVPRDDAGSMPSQQPSSFSGGKRAIKVELWQPMDFNSPVSNDLPNTSSTGAVSGKKWKFINTVVPNRWGGDSDYLVLLEEAQKKADGILLTAQQTADEILREAQEEAQKLRDLAHQQGLQAALEEIGTSIRAAGETLDTIHQWQRNLVETSQTLILGLIREMAVSLFGDGVRLDESALQLNLNRIVEKARALGDLQIYLNPKDAARLEPAWREYQSLVMGSKVQVIPSEQVTQGGCFIKGEMGTLDARVETQLENALQAFSTLADF